jgi:hypothetical protein
LLPTVHRVATSRYRDFLDFAAISMDFAETQRFLLHFYIIFTTADLMFCYSSRKLLLQRL